MKKLSAIILALTLAFTLAACVGGNSDTPSGNVGGDNTLPPASNNGDGDTSTPDTTPPDNSGTNDPGPGTSGGDGFFPGIDDSLLPSDIVKKIVGTLQKAEYSDGPFDGIRQTGQINLLFVDVTEDDYSALKEHYGSGANEFSDEDIYEAKEFSIRYFIDWGNIWVRYYSDNGKIEVYVSIME